jgi:hypothetical protein
VAVDNREHLLLPSDAEPLSTLIEQLLAAAPASRLCAVVVRLMRVPAWPAHRSQSSPR